MPQKKWVLLDRDGTLIAERHYLHDPDAVKVLDGAAEGLRILNQAGYHLVIVTNQSGVGRGYFSESDVEAVHERLLQLLQDEGIVIDGIYSCFHRPTEQCTCRKPQTGLAIRAARELGFLLDEVACVIGDKQADVEFGSNLGVHTVLVMTGYGKEERTKGVRADFYAETLKEAANWILRSNT